VATSRGVFDEARIQDLRERLHAPPAAREEQAVAPTRWTLQRVKEQWADLADYSLAGISGYLHRYGLAWRRGRVHYCSPDPQYRVKEAQLLSALRLAGAFPSTHVALFFDEVSYTAWPDLAYAWEDQAPAAAPLADRQQSDYRRMRIVGALDAVSGCVLIHQEARIAGSVFAAFVQQVAAAYAHVEHLYLLWDNWPVHRCDALQAVLAHLPQVHVIALPTYAPWLNPIEKLWRKMRQDSTALHRQAKDWKQLQKQVQQFFDQFAHGSDDLLRYVGLLGNGKLACALKAGP
jgi:transposase